MFGKRPPWPYLVTAAVGVALAVFAVIRLSEPELVPLAPAEHTGVTIAGQVSVEPAGQVLTARANVTADRPVLLRKVTVKMRDEQGVVQDFPARENVELGTAPGEIVLTRPAPPAGTYTYYLAYQLDGDWVGLPPWQQIRIR